MIVDRISLILVIIGALNWGSIGLFQFDLVSWICRGIRPYHLFRRGAGRSLVHFPPVPLAR